MLDGTAVFTRSGLLRNTGQKASWCRLQFEQNEHLWDWGEESGES